MGGVGGTSRKMRNVGRAPERAVLKQIGEGIQVVGRQQAQVSLRGPEAVTRKDLTSPLTGQWVVEAEFPDAGSEKGLGRKG